MSQSIRPDEVRVGDYISVKSFRQDASGRVSRIEVTERHVDRAGVQKDYVFYHHLTRRDGTMREATLATATFGFLMQIQRF